MGVGEGGYLNLADRRGANLMGALIQLLVSIFVQTSSSIGLITLILVSLERSFPRAGIERLVKGGDVRSGRKAKARHSQLGPAQESMG